MMSHALSIDSPLGRQHLSTRTLNALLYHRWPEGSALVASRWPTIGTVCALGDLDALRIKHFGAVALGELHALRRAVAADTAVATGGASPARFSSDATGAS
jgi:hypothetical protein